MLGSIRLFLRPCYFSYSLRPCASVRVKIDTPRYVSPRCLCFLSTSQPGNEHRGILGQLTLKPSCKRMLSRSSAIHALVSLRAFIRLDLSYEILPNSLKYSDTLLSTVIPMFCIRGWIYKVKSKVGIEKY